MPAQKPTVAGINASFPIGSLASRAGKSRLHTEAATGKTLLVITHDPEFILNCCQSVIRMKHGKIAESYSLSGNEERLVQTMVEC